MKIIKIYHHFRLVIHTYYMSRTSFLGQRKIFCLLGACILLTITYILQKSYYKLLHNMIYIYLPKSSIPGEQEEAFTILLTIIIIIIIVL